MNIKQLVGVVVFVLVFGVASNALVNHVFTDSIKFNEGMTGMDKTKLQQQNTAPDKPEGKSDKADTVKVQSKLENTWTILVYFYFYYFLIGFLFPFHYCQKE